MYFTNYDFEADTLKELGDNILNFSINTQRRIIRNPVAAVKVGGNYRYMEPILEDAFYDALDKRLVGELQAIEEEREYRSEVAFQYNQGAL